MGGGKKLSNNRQGRFSGAGSNPAPEEPALNHEHKALRKWLKETKFKRAIFGGVRESDVWKKIGELNALYEAALSAERARYDALLAAGTAPDEELPNG